jgi:hypothetical protein
VGLISKAYTAAFKAFDKSLGVYLPFLVFALIEFTALILLYLAPRPPIRALLGSPIAVIWGERFLHYPANFLLLPKLAYYSRMCLSVLFGSLMTGLAVAIVYTKPLKSVYKKYVSLCLVALIITVIFNYAFRIMGSLLLHYFSSGHDKLLSFGPEVWFGTIYTTLNFLLLIVIQAAFTYTIPILIAGDQKLLKAIWTSFKIFKRYWVVSLVLVGLPMLIDIPVIVLYSNTMVLMDKFFPEIILYVAILSVVVNSLIIDPLVTISTAQFYAQVKKI